jgi:non-specific serine/threonine protein kinase
VGRTRELADVCELIGARGLRLVTLTGPGGVGKTRLALAVARQLEDAFPDGVFFIAFEAVADPGQALVEISQATRVPDMPGRSLRQRIQGHFRGRRLLMVLDNLEHLPGFEWHVADLLDANPSIHILCTSRSPLGISGEQVYPVPPLHPDQAARLFADRAMAVQPAFAAEPVNGGMVSDICERLEYLPLAIELAAARIHVLPLPALIDRLDHQLSVLSNGPRDAARRHRAMRDAIAWSHDLLDPADHVLLRRLAVFSGGFSLEAARAVANDDVDALEGISRLVAAGLVLVVPGPGGDARFRLPVPIREFAHEHLEEHAEVEAVRTRHSLYARDWTESAILRLDGPELPVWRQRIDIELDNCRAAMAWAITSEAWETAIRIAGALWRIWWPQQEIGGKAWTERVNEGVSWIERALPHRGDLPIQSIVEALIGGSVLNALLGRHNASHDYAVELLQTSESPPFPYGQFWAFLQLGDLAHCRGDWNEAKDLLERALCLASEVRDPEYHAAMASSYLVEVANRVQDDVEALRIAEAGLASGRLCGNEHVRSMLALDAGKLRLTLGDPLGASRLLVESAEAFAAKHDVGGVRTALTEMARASLACNQVEIATTLLMGVHNLPSHVLDRSDHDMALTELASRLGISVDDLISASRIDLGIPELLEVARSLTVQHVALPASLTLREMEVLHLVAEGRSNRVIADRLSISERTVENHVHHILDKLGLDSRTAAATWAVRHGHA